MIRSRIFFFVARKALSVFFRKILIEGAETLSASCGILIVANHVNAFIDGILIASVSPRHVVLTAKASLRKDFFLRLILWLAGAEVMYRSSDDNSHDAKKANIEILHKLSLRLQKGEIVCIFPEGVSHSDVGLREFKTGAARILMDTWEKSPSVKLVPATLLYEQKASFRSDVIVQFHSPITKDAVMTDSLDAKNLTKDLQFQLEQKLPIFQSEEERSCAQWIASGYTSYRNSSEWVGAQLNDIESFFEIMGRASDTLKKLRDKMPEEYNTLLKRITHLKSYVESTGLSFQELFIEINSLQAAVFFFREIEVFILSCIEGIIGFIFQLPVIVAAMFIVQKTRDEDHVATNVIFISTPIFLLWNLFLLFLALVNYGYMVGFGYFVVIIFSSLLLPLVYDRMTRVKRRVCMFLSIVQKRETATSLRKELLSLREYLLYVEESVQ